MKKTLCLVLACLLLLGCVPVAAAFPPLFGIVAFFYTMIHS